MQRIEPQQCAIVVVDVQEKLAAAMPPPRMADVVRAGNVLLEAARVLGARVVATEQYPTGLGKTMAPLAEKLAALGAPIVSKLDFSAWDEPEFQKTWTAFDVRAAVVIGVETHVCVLQTVRDLCTHDVQVFVPIDGVASRRDDHRAAGLDLCRGAGATLTTMESVVFDWLRRAGTDPFKQLSKLIR
jgi:nicotinamidase-related amidase